MSEAEKEAREALADRLREIGAVQYIDNHCGCNVCKGVSEWVNAPLQVVLDEASRAPQPTDDDREALDYAIRVPISEANVDYRPLWKLIKAIQDSVIAAGFRRAPAEPTDEYVRHGVCLLCGGAVMNSGEHIEPGRHAAEVARITGEPAVTDEMVEAFTVAINRAGYVLDRDATRMGLRATLTTKEGEDR